MNSEETTMTAESTAPTQAMSDEQPTMGEQPTADGPTMTTGQTPVTEYHPTPTGAPQASPAPAPIPRATDGLAIGSFVCGLVGLGLIAIILGHVALRRIRTSGDAGSGFAIVGLVLGYLAVAAVIVGLIVAAVTTIWAVNA